MGGVFIWQRMRDSNPRKRSQSPVCYRYTNPLCCGQHEYYIAISKNVKYFFQFLYFLFGAPLPVGSMCIPSGFIPAAVSSTISATCRNAIKTPPFFLAFPISP